MSERDSTTRRGKADLTGAQVPARIRSNEPGGTLSTIAGKSQSSRRKPVRGRRARAAGCASRGMPPSTPTTVRARHRHGPSPPRRGAAACARGRGARPCGRTGRVSRRRHGCRARRRLVMPSEQSPQPRIPARMGYEVGSHATRSGRRSATHAAARSLAPLPRENGAPRWKSDR